MKAIQSFKDSLSFDYRSMALYRFLLGIMICIDVIYRMGDLTNFYTDVGLVPRSLFLTEMSMPWSFSLHLANGSLFFIVLMFFFHLLIGVMVIIGYKTTLAMILAFIMNVSLHNRNWLINNGGDDIMRAILFLSIFLPLNKYFSLDAAFSEEKRPVEKNYFSTWTLAFYLQVFVIYFVSYILKNHAIWRSQYTAFFFASRLDIFATPIGLWLRSFQTLQKIVTIFTIFLEWLGPLLLVFSALIGKRWWMIRMIVITLFLALHMGIILTMWIGVFPYLCLAMWMIFLPSDFWDRISSFFAKRFNPCHIYFDGDCGVCKKIVLIFREFLLVPKIKISIAQDNPEILKEMNIHHSWVVVNEKDEHFYHFSGFIELIKNSCLFFWLQGLLPKSLGHKTYIFISEHRAFLSKMSQHFYLRPEKKTFIFFRWIKEMIGAFIFATLLMWNLTTIKKWNFHAPFFQKVIRGLHLYQEWNMFAPFPKMDNIWVEIPATLGDGSQMELLSGSRDIYGVKASLFPGLVKNEHWRKFFLNVSERTEYSKYYAGFLCRQWNDRHIRKVSETTLKKFDIIVYSQPIQTDGSAGGIYKKMSWSHWCFDEDDKNKGLK